MTGKKKASILSTAWTVKFSVSGLVSGQSSHLPIYVCATSRQEAIKEAKTYMREHAKGMKIIETISARRIQ
jgi:hypothetical protein